jgi:hypothetical protein
VNHIFSSLNKLDHKLSIEDFLGAGPSEPGSSGGLPELVLDEQNQAKGPPRIPAEGLPFAITCPLH